MTITVTEKHIAAATPGAAGSCPIALAMNEATGTIWHVGPLHNWSHEWRAENLATGRVMLPREAVRFAIQFDRKDKVLPFSFEIPGGAQ